MESALEPTMSQNMMVSWRRSAVGVGAVDAGRERGRAAGWDASDVRLAPHLEQNLAFAELACAQLGQGRGSAVPHSYCLLSGLHRSLGTALPLPQLL